MAASIGACWSRIVPMMRGRDLAVHVLDGLEHALAEEAAFVAVAQFDGFVLAGGCAGGNRGAADRAAFEPHVHFDGGIAARVDHFAAADFNNGGIAHGLFADVEGGLWWIRWVRLIALGREGHRELGSHLGSVLVGIQPGEQMQSSLRAT